MLDRVNDSEDQARRLAKLLANRPAKLNLIPLNPFPGVEFARSTDEAIERFQRILQVAGIVTVVRRTRGDDIDAACGQLAGQVENRIRSPLGTKLQADTWLT
jgi:23S rRNA (adenine2503-C2)-methyltransferase